MLRLTAGARAAQHKIGAAVIWALAPFVAALVGMISVGAPAGRLTIGLLLAMFVNLVIWLFVLNASRRTLKPDLLQPQSLPVKTLQPGLTSELAGPLPQQKYVTEGTTELLVTKPKESEQELVYRMGRDTSPTD